MNKLEIIQDKLEFLMKKWWFYGIVLLISFFLPIISEVEYTYEQIPEIIYCSLSQGLNSYTILAIFLRISLFAFIALILILKDRISRYFSLFIGINYILSTFLQNIVYTIEYGRVVILSNLFLTILPGIFWIWESVAHKNDLNLRKVSSWKYWVIAFGFLAFWWPMNSEALPDFNFLYLLSSEAMLAFCTITPVYLTILSFYHPYLNSATIRMTSFVGIYMGIINLINGILDPLNLWWLTILHVPLLLVSLYMFIFSFYISDSSPSISD